MDFIPFLKNGRSYLWCLTLYGPPLYISHIYSKFLSVNKGEQCYLGQAVNAAVFEMTCFLYGFSMRLFCCGCWLELNV